MAEATGHGLAAKMREYEGVDMAGFVQRYLSPEHRDGRADGCAMAALGGDAPRQPVAVQARFEAGIAATLAAVERGAVASGAEPAAALVLSRACPAGSALSDELLDVCRAQALAALAPQAPDPTRRARRPRRAPAAA